jgi:hypothetical protein
MKTIKHIRFIKAEDGDLTWFAEEIIRITEKLQDNGWQVEYDYKPLLNKKNIIYTCMIRAFVI